MTQAAEVTRGQERNRSVGDQEVFWKNKKTLDLLSSCFCSSPDLLLTRCRYRGRAYAINSAPVTPLTATTMYCLPFSM